MAGENPTVSPEELLAHAEWIRRLARALVGSQTDAADLAQDTLDDYMVGLSGVTRT